MKYFLIFVAVFCLVYIVRDYLQIKGVQNKFTQFGHIWDAPKYEKPGMVIFAIIGIICLYFAIMLT
jgi:hypothetical protein